MKVSNSQKRLIEMMNTLGIKQADIEKRTGVKAPTLSNYMSGRRTPTQEMLSKIADPYGINPAWLMGYDVPMRVLIDEYIHSERDRSILKKKDSLINKAMELYKLYEQASPEIQRAVDAILKSSQPTP